MPKTDKIVVKVSQGFTINLGGYESARIEVGVEIQGKRTEKEKLWEEAENEVTKHLNREVQALMEAVDEKKTILGLPKGPTFK